MVPKEQTPTFNLKAVVQETGLKPDTLRAWERRYGLPQPNRTAGGHRLYSQRDIDTLKWLVARQKEGLSISRAVNLWQQLEAENQDPLRTMPEPMAISATSPATGETIVELRQAWVSACLNFDERQAEYILTQAFALYPPETVCLELLVQGLVHIGKGWYQGEITVQQEHFASALASRRLEALIAAAPVPSRPKRMLVGCAPHEEHTVGPLLLTLLLRRQGWDVVYLGANIPLAQLEHTITSAKPHLVILSAQQLSTAATLMEMAQQLQQEQVPVAYGGRVFNLIPALQARIPGHFLGERLDLVPQVVGQLLASSLAVPTGEPASEAYQQALAHYRRRQAAIEAEVWQALENMNISDDFLTLVNSNLAHYIIAALTLGDIDYLGIDMAWLEELLVNYDQPSELLGKYLDTYRQIARTHLDERGDPIINWLAQLTANGKTT